MVTKLQNSSIKKLHSVSNLYYEQASWSAKKVVCGVDEVGRGCLAGPVVAAAVIFPPGAVIGGVKDSKKINKKYLSDLASKIVKNSWYGIGIADQILIDSCNIRQATFIAMRRAMTNLLAICPIFPDKVLVDDMPLGQYFKGDAEFISAPKGESWSYSIAAASILAKVKRDSMMDRYNVVFPNLYFDKHKGYGTKLHYQQLDNFDKTLIHRDTFLKSYKKDKALQNSLF